MTAAQHPLTSGYGRTTTAEIALNGADLSGKCVLITGGYAGLGLETARVLSKAGAALVVPARDLSKAQAALQGLPRVDIHAMDLADPASIDAFARTFIASGRGLDLLIANAGVMATPLEHDARGYERQFATNHLGHFQLVARLWPSLQAGRARVVVLSSGAHRFSDIDFDDPNYQRRAYDKWKAYGQSKTANALFALGLDRRGEAHGVRAFSVHPGAIATTDLQRHLTLSDLQAMGFRDAEGNIPPAIAALFKSVQQGAATTVWCATSPQLAGLGGVYCEDCDIALGVPADAAGWDGVMPWATDAAGADRLWELSEQLSGVAFAI